MTLAERFRERGYRTGAFTAGGFLNEWYGFAQGFDTFVKHEHASGVGTEPIVTAALDWIHRGRSRPFFAFVHTYAPHVPYVHAELADPAAAGRLPGQFPFEFLETTRRGELVLTEAERRYVTDLYDGGVAYADRALGRMFDVLRADGTLDRAIVIVTSDHGEDLWNHVAHRSPDHGHSLYEELIRVPLLVRAPGLAAGGARIRTPVSLVDVAPTLLTLAGLPLDPAFEGRDLADAIRSGREPSSVPVYAEATSAGPERFAVRLDATKLIAAPHPEPVDGITVPPLEAFDLAVDADEQRPLTDGEGAHAALAAALAARAARSAGARAPEDASPPPDIEDRLRNLGYVQ